MPSAPEMALGVMVLWFPRFDSLDTLVPGDRRHVLIGNNDQVHEVLRFKIVLHKINFRWVFPIKPICTLIEFIFKLVIQDGSSKVDPLRICKPERTIQVFESDK